MTEGLRTKQNTKEGRKEGRGWISEQRKEMKTLDISERWN